MSSKLKPLPRSNDFASSRRHFQAIEGLYSWQFCIMAIVVNIICLKMVEKLKDGLFKHTLLEQKKKKKNDG